MRKISVLISFLLAIGFVFIFSCGSVEEVNEPQQSSSSVKSSSVSTKPESFDEYEDVMYKKLCSEAFLDEFDGKYVHFSAMFVNEFTLVDFYRNSKIDTENKVFINHRDVSYVAQDTGLGSSDMMIPEFAIAVDKQNSDIVYSSARGDVIEVWGKAKKVGGAGKLQILITADKIVKKQ